ncbi:ABC transporter ATP-binding protein [uncultured Thiothrix sp.]|uniref:ABC transporter ATP-binding protein n=1 Tax=uncultured Thiothrix sp. TaxID=223185 RepID=UPI00345DD508
MSEIETVIAVSHLQKQVLAADANNNQATLSILSDINLSISCGTSVAITGASGSGKSTLLGLLAGLDLPSAGNIALFGQALTTLSEDQRAALRLGKVGFVFQSFHLLEHLTALENVLLPLELGNNSGDLTQRALTALEQVGLAARAQQLVTKLSGGEQQRVALARAFVTQPKLLFADEPTGNLDRHTGQEVAALLFRLQHDYQTTLVLVTHDESLAAQCDVWYRLADGRLQQQEPSA